jgi:hypothetical protein
VPGALGAPEGEPVATRIRADGPVVEWGFGDVWEGPGDVKVMRPIARTGRGSGEMAPKPARERAEPSAARATPGTRVVIEGADPEAWEAIPSRGGGESTCRRRARNPTSW